MLPVVEKNFFKFLVKGKISDINEIEEKANLYELSINKPYYSCAVFQIDFKDLTDQSFLIEDIISSLYGTIRTLFEFENIGYFYIDDNFEIVAIFNFELHYSSSSSYDYVSIITQKIYDLIKESLHPIFAPKVFCGIGNIYNGILSLSSAYNQANLALKRKFFDENDGIYYAWKEKSIYTSMLKEYPFDTENDLLNSILEGNMEQITILLKAYWEEFNILLKQIDPTDVHTIIIQFLNMLERRLNKHGNSLQDLMGISPPFTDYINSMDTLSGLKENINKLVYTVTEKVQIINDKVRTSSFASIQVAQKYIEEHYNEKITLENISEKAFMSPSYFSVQFKKEMGKNFVEYLKEYRIEKAKDLLRVNNLKVYEISEMVGYQNPKYFTDMFKAFTGLTPLEYRQKIITS